MNDVIENTREDLKELVGMAKDHAVNIVGMGVIKNDPAIFNEILRAAVSVYITQGQLGIQNMAIPMPDFSALTPKEGS